MKTACDSQTEFYKEYLMRRGDSAPLEFGIDLTKEALADILIDEFNSTFKGFSFDELLLRPKVALMFCDDVRKKHAFYDLPDDILLRLILNRRKASGA